MTFFANEESSLRPDTYDVNFDLSQLYGIKMVHIDLESVMPTVFHQYNLEHPNNRDAEEYGSKFNLYDGNSPDYYEYKDQGYGWADRGVFQQHVMRETDGYCIAHCFLQKGESFNFPDLFNRKNKSNLETDIFEELKRENGLKVQSL